MSAKFLVLFCLSCDVICLVTDIFVYFFSLYVLFLSFVILPRHFWIYQKVGFLLGGGVMASGSIPPPVCPSKHNAIIVYGQERQLQVMQSPLIVMSSLHAIAPPINMDNNKWKIG